MKTVSNQELTIRVSEHGAELSSIVANATGKEYLWQAGPRFLETSFPGIVPDRRERMEGRVSERGNRVSAVAARLCTGYGFYVDR